MNFVLSLLIEGQRAYIPQRTFLINKGDVPILQKTSLNSRKIVVLYYSRVTLMHDMTCTITAQYHNILELS